MNYIEAVRKATENEKLTRKSWGDDYFYLDKEDDCLVWESGRWSNAKGSFDLAPDNAVTWNTVTIGWIPTVEDALADDWEVFTQPPPPENTVDFMARFSV